MISCVDQRLLLLRVEDMFVDCTGCFLFWVTFLHRISSLNAFVCQDFIDIQEIQKGIRISVAILVYLWHRCSIPGTETLGSPSAVGLCWVFATSLCVSVIHTHIVHSRFSSLLLFVFYQVLWWLLTVFLYLFCAAVGKQHLESCSLHIQLPQAVLLSWTFEYMH